MLMIRKFRVKKDERALLFNRGDFVAVLGPGEHVLFDPLFRLKLDTYRLAEPADFLCKELQFGLRAAVGARTLDELLENKGVIDQVVAGHVAQRVEGFDLKVDSVGVKDIILPGDMKTILAKVVEADKIALATRCG